MSSSSVAKSAIGLTCIMVLGYALSFVKEAVIANYFGISKDVDAYAIAIQIPVILFSFVAVAIQSVVVPLYSDLLYKKNTEDASRFASNLLFVVLLVALVFCLLCEFFANSIITIFAPGFSREVNELATQLLRITLPTVFFSLTSKVFTAILNVHKKYIIPEFSLLLLNISLIVTIVILHANYGIVSACIGQVIGCVLQFLFLHTIVRKVFKLSVIIDFKDSNLRTALKMSLPVFWSISVAEINAMVNRMVASFLFVGSIAALNYSQKLYSVFVTFFTSAIATIVYPMYAESEAKGDKEQLVSRINMTISAYAFILLPVMLYIICFSREIVIVAFARGAFDVNAVDMTQMLLKIYSFSIIFLAMRGTITNVFYSLKDSKTPAKNASIGILINIALNLTLPFVIGINGIAIASMISAIYISIMLLYLLVKENKSINLHYFFSNLKGIMFAGLSVIILLIVCRHYLLSVNVYTQLIIGFIVCCISYLSVAYISKTPILLTATRMIHEKILKK